jgi:hypothetical protein
MGHTYIYTKYTLTLPPSLSISLDEIGRIHAPAVLPPAIDETLSQA